MKSLLEQVNGLDSLHRQLQKMESRMRSGQFIDAWKDCTRLIAIIDRAKSDLIKSEEESNKGDNDAE
jgi:head-tail adaptor